MEAYSGNKDPFVFVLFPPEQEPLARRISEKLGTKTKLYLTSALGKKERLALDKAAAILPILTEAFADTATALLADPAAQNKPLIPVFPERFELPAGLRMLLGSTQGLRRYDYESEEAFLRALCAAPALNALAVSPAQKKAARRTLIAAAGAFAALLLAALQIVFRPFLTNRIEEDSTLGQLGLMGDPARIRTVALYGSELKKTFEDQGVYQAYVSVVNNGSLGGLYLPAEDSVAQIGQLSDLSDFTQLKNLEELSLAGNAIEDATPLFALKKLKKLDLSQQLRVIEDPERRELENILLSLDGISALDNLETLYFCYNRWPEDGSVPAWLYELDAMPKFKTLVLECGVEVLPALQGKVHYDIALLGTEVGNFEELQAAAEDPTCHCIYVRPGTELTIPAGETWTLPKNTMLGGVNFTIRILGTMRVYGWYECGMTHTVNEGTVIVEDGGSVIGGMSDMTNHGSFTVEEGGLHLIERGVEFWQQSGSYVNRGLLIVGFGGKFHYDGGEAVNDGRILIEDAGSGNLPTPDWYEEKLATAGRFTGSGSVEFAGIEGCVG